MKSPQEFPLTYSNAIRWAQVDELTALYDDSVKMFDMWDEWSLSGLDAIREMAKEWFSSLGSEHVVVSFTDQNFTEGADLALMTCFVRFAAHDNLGARIRYLEERMTVTFRKKPSGDWKVIHQHTSSPVGSEDLKAKLKINADLEN